MKKYIGTKELSAQSMTLGAYNTYRGWTIPAAENPERAGFLVRYTDGYESWSPVEVFVEAYQPLDRMNFGHAVEMLKKGHKVARAGWNGKGMFVYLVPPASYPVQTGAAKSYFGEGSLVPYNAYMAIKNVDDTVSTWVPSVNDVLADDWAIVE